mmetsp:Transcript_123256/g.230410  ORF Transcript_123256/g.230410 Transcript_123256/m.230410 type:complete len:206 (-) Transcript_123256:379-996(-)
MSQDPLRRDLRRRGRGAFWHSTGAQILYSSSLPAQELLSQQRERLLHIIPHCHVTVQTFHGFANVVKLLLHVGKLRTEVPYSGFQRPQIMVRQRARAGFRTSSTDARLPHRTQLRAETLQALSHPGHLCSSLLATRRQVHELRHLLLKDSYGVCKVRALQRAQVHEAARRALLSTHRRRAVSVGELARLQLTAVFQRTAHAELVC